MPFKVPTVDRFLCGCNLRTGSAIIGIIFAIMNLSQMCSSSVYASDAKYHENSGGDASRGAYITQAVVSGIMFGANLILLWSIHKEIAKWIFPWLITYSCLFSLGLFSIWFLSVYVLIVDFIAGVLLICISVLYFAVYGYCIIVIYSYYLSLIGALSAVPTQEPAFPKPDVV